MSITFQLSLSGAISRRSRAAGDMKALTPVRNDATGVGVARAALNHYVERKLTDDLFS
jgi:hypothetical protein